MNIVSLLKSSWQCLRRRPVLVVPLLAVAVLVALLSLALVGSLSPHAMAISGESEIGAAGAMRLVGATSGRLLTLLIVTSILGLLAHGMTVFMANGAVADDPVGLKEAWSATATRVVPLAIAAIIVGLLVSFGLVLLVLPGVILAFLLMFTFVIVMVDERNAFQAMGDSFRIVTGNFGAVFVFFLVLIALGVLVILVNFVVGMIPVLGALLTIVVGATYVAFVSVFVVAVYREISLSGGSADAPEV